MTSLEARVACRVYGHLLCKRGQPAAVGLSCENHSLTRWSVSYLRSKSSKPWTTVVGSLMVV
jgi:hypothetical protein